MKTELKQADIFNGYLAQQLELPTNSKILEETISWNAYAGARNDETVVHFNVCPAENSEEMGLLLVRLSKVLGIELENFKIATDWARKFSTVEAVVTIPDGHTHGVAGDFYVCSERCGDDGELHVAASFDTEDGARAWMRRKYEEYRAKNDLRPNDFTWQHGFKADGCHRWTCYDNASSSPYGEWIVDQVEVGDVDAESRKEAGNV